MHFSLKAHLMRRWRILNISLDTFMVIIFAGALRQALLHVFERRTLPLCCCGTLNIIKLLCTVMAQFRVVSSSAVIFSSIIDGCLKYKNEKPKTGPRPGPRLNYDVNIGLKPSPRDVKMLELDFKLNIFFKVCCNASVTEHVQSKILLKID